VRILAITNLYPRPGNELFAPYNRQQFRFLARENELSVIAPVAWTIKVKEWARLRHTPGKYLNDHGTWVYHPTYYFPPKVFQHRHGQWYLRSIGRLAEGLLREFRPQVVLSSWAHPDGWAAVRIARQAGLPTLIKVHGSDVLVATRKPRRRRRIAEALAGADGVVAVCQDLANHVVGLGVDARKIRVIPHGTDETVFCPGDQRKARARLGLAAEGDMVLFVGNLLTTKGAGVLIEACGRLRDQGRQLSCYLIGRGMHESRLRALIRRLRLGDRVMLVGGCRPEVLADWYRACDLVALPSFSEGIPNVLREALRCGKPFVATHVGGIPEIAHPSFSSLVPPGAVPELAEAITMMLATRPHVDRALLAERTISWTHSARLLAEYLEEIVKGRSPHGS
jgi:glycosyltransferase involved in cell wall biosynthesis